MGWNQTERFSFTKLNSFEQPQGHRTRGKSCDLFGFPSISEEQTKFFWWLHTTEPMLICSDAPRTCCRACQCCCESEMGKPTRNDEPEHATRGVPSCSYVVGIRHGVITALALRAVTRASCKTVQTRVASLCYFELSLAHKCWRERLWQSHMCACAF